MIATLFAVGKNMPNWVEQAYHEYAKRLPKSFALNLVEIPAISRHKNSNIDKIKSHECELLQKACEGHGLKIVLDEHGKSLSTLQLAENLIRWQENYREISFIVGGPDGLTQDFIQSADLAISLSTLTLPHPLVRVLLAEQLYRAYSIITNHPYHRA